jgi:hypothetical protein
MRGNTWTGCSVAKARIAAQSSSNVTNQRGETPPNLTGETRGVTVADERIPVSNCTESFDRNDSATSSSCSFSFSKVVVEDENEDKNEDKNENENENEDE